MQVHPEGVLLAPTQIGNPIGRWFDVVHREVVYIVLLAGIGCFVVFIIILIFLMFLNIIPKF